MSKTVAINLLNKLDDESITLARIATITGTDGTIYRMTDHDVDLVVGANTYLSESGFEPTDLLENDQRGVNAIRLLFNFTATGIVEDDVRRGLLKSASFDMRVVDPTDTADETLILMVGVFGEIQVTNDDAFFVDIVGLNSENTLRDIGERYTPHCRASLGDSRCGVDVDALKSLAWVVTSVDSNNIEITGAGGTPDVEIQSANYFKYGVLKWTTGDNIGLAFEIVTHTQNTPPTVVSTTLQLALQPPRAVGIGDEATIWPGCQKDVAACVSFSNIANFLGEPYVPTADFTAAYTLTETGDSETTPVVTEPV